MNTQVLPWYRYSIVWLVIAIPAASVLAGILMTYLAVNSEDGLVIDDYYKQGLAINQNLQRDRVATELGLSAELNVDAYGDMITLTFNKGELQQYPERLTLHFQHATQADFDQVLSLVRAPNDQYIGHLTEAIRDGVWHIMLTTEQWRLVDRVHWQNGLRISLTPQSI